MKSLSFLLGLLLCARGSSLTAATRIWDGGGLAGSWTNSMNWSNNVSPAVGDVLLFPGDAARRTNVNNFPNGRRFHSIALATGYSISGNAIQLSSNLSCHGLGGVSTFQPDMTLTTNVTVEVGVFGGLSLGGDINLNGRNLRAQLDGWALVSGNISGTGNVHKFGNGTLHLTGNSTFNDDCRAYEGTVRVDGVLSNATVTAYSGATLAGEGVCNVISVAGTLSPGHNGPAILRSRSHVWLDGNSAAGQLATYLCQLNGPDAGSGYDQLALSGYLYIKDTVLNLSIGAPLGLGQRFTIIRNEGGWFNGDTFLGLPDDSLFSTNGYLFHITYRGITGNAGDVVLTVLDAPGASIALWDGGGMNAFWSTPANWSGNAVPTAGKPLSFPPGAARGQSTNDLAPGTAFNGIYFGDTNYTLRGAAVSLNGGITNSVSGTNRIDLGLTLNAPQRFHIDGQVGHAAVLIVNGSISGAGGIIKSGVGLLILNGTNTCTGPTTISQGFVQMNGTLDNSPLAIDGGLFMGNGAVGPVTATGGTLSPGSGIGRLRVNGSLMLESGSTFAISASGVDAGVTYDQLSVVGSVTLANPTLNASIMYTTAPGDSFVLIDNDGNDPVTGTFAGMAEGEIIFLATRAFRISYAGGDGNDVVLTRVLTPAPQITAINPLANGQVQLHGAGIAGLLYFLHANTNLSTPNWPVVGAVIADANGALQFLDASATNHPMRFYRIRVQ